MTLNNLIRVVTLFDIHTNRLVGEIELNRDEFEIIRSLMGHPETDLMNGGSYPIDIKLLPKLSELLGSQVTSQSGFAYFLETYSRDCR